MKNDHAKPVNKTAALVASNGVHHEYAIRDHIADRSIPFELNPDTSVLNKGDEALIGTVKGRLTVMGLAVARKGSARDKKGAGYYTSLRFSCKCSCGMYVLRSIKAIKAPVSDAHCCYQCERLLLAKAKEHFRRTGKYVEREKFL